MNNEREAEQELASLEQQIHLRTAKEAVAALMGAFDVLHMYVLDDELKKLKGSERCYRVLRKEGWWPFRGYEVKSTTATMVLFEGSKRQCELVAARLLMAYRDAHYMSWNQERERMKDLIGNDVIHYHSKLLVQEEDAVLANKIIETLLDDFQNHSYY